ncbi:hypothetical protein AX016_0430 [Cellulophaga sp. RHA19]|nr:hypothetical protein AX016_0430 [Cellulophaga sp. RHA19]
MSFFDTKYKLKANEYSLVVPLVLNNTNITLSKDYKNGYD